MLGRGAHQAHPAGPSTCARLRSPLLHLQQRTTLSQSIKTADCSGAGSLSAGLNMTLFRRCMISTSWRCASVAGWSAVRLMGILIEISLQIIAIEQHHSAPRPACCSTAPGVRGSWAHQGLALLEGPAQRLKEAEEHRRVDAVADGARPHTPAGSSQCSNPVGKTNSLITTKKYSAA